MRLWMRTAIFALVFAFSGSASAQAPGAEPSQIQRTDEQPAQPAAQGQDVGTAAPTASEVAAQPAAGSTENTPSAEPSQPSQVPASAPTPAPAPADAADANEAAPAQAPAEQPLPLKPEELRALGIEADSEGSVDAVDTDLHISGFMDAMVQGLLKSASSALIFGDEVSFFVGSLNVYLRKNLNESFRTMAEVRFTYLPNGYDVRPGGNGFTSTETLDYTGLNAQLKWGGIEIERAYIEWTVHPQLSIRLGQFLTPYGIWNIDHGSPVFIPTQRPYAVSGALFPERQTGLEVFGRWDMFADAAIGYHLTLSNGTGPVSEYRDLDANKALGGRVYVEYRALGHLQIGVSGYYGRDSSATLGYGQNDKGELELVKHYTSQADIAAAGADVLWKYEALHLQGEWIGRQTRYTEHGRPPVAVGGQFGVPLNALEPDQVAWSGYALLGYRLPWFGIMPYVTLEYMKALTYGLQTKQTWTQLGFNIRPVAEVVFKLEYLGTLSASNVPGGTELVQGQVAWVF